MRLLLWRTGSAAVVAALAFSGCASYEAKPVSSEIVAADFEARRLDDPELAAFIAMAGHVAPSVGSPWDAERLTIAAWWFNGDLKVARARWAAAQAEIITAGGRPNPTLSLQPGYNFSATGGVSPWMPSGGLDIPIETSGKRDRRIEAAERRADSARCALAGTAWKIRSAVHAELAALSTARARRRILSGLVSAGEKLSAMQEQRLENGVIARSELLPQKLALLRARSDLAAAEALEADAESRLAEAVGVPVAEIRAAHPAVDAGRAATLRADFDERAAREAALKHRADILGALADYAASEAALHLEIAKQYPDIHLGSTYQWDQGQSKWQFGLSAEIPLLNRNEGPIAEASARREVARATFAALQEKAVAATSRALASLRRAEQRLADTDTELALRRRCLADSEAGLAAGDVEPADTMALRVELLSAELVLDDIASARRASLGLLEDALECPVAAGMSEPASWENPYAKEDRS